MKEEQYLQLTEKLGEIKGKVDTGFLAITQRMDIANNRTTKSEIRIESLEAFMNNIKGRLAIWGMLSGSITGLLVGIVLWFLQRYLH